MKLFALIALSLAVPNFAHAAANPARCSIANIEKTLVNELWAVTPTQAQLDEGNWLQDDPESMSDANQIILGGRAFTENLYRFCILPADLMKTYTVDHQQVTLRITNSDLFDLIRQRCIASGNN